MAVGEFMYARVRVIAGLFLGGILFYPLPLVVSPLGGTLFLAGYDLRFLGGAALIGPFADRSRPHFETLSLCGEWRRAARVAAYQSRPPFPITI